MIIEIETISIVIWTMLLQKLIVAECVWKNTQGSRKETFWKKSNVKKKVNNCKEGRKNKARTRKVRGEKRTRSR